MNVVEPGSPAESMMGRARALLMRPLETWDVIDAEEATIEGLYKTWVIPLAAIPAVCRAVHGLSSHDAGLFGFRYRPSFFSIFSEAVISYAMTLVSVFVFAVVVDELALRFGGERSRTQAFKLGAYSATAGWLAGIFLLIPMVGPLLSALGVLYGVYLLYLGLPKLMRSDPDRTMVYFLAAVGATLLLMILIASLSSCFGGWGGPIRID